MERKSWWQKPVLRTDEESNMERSATWLELFFDLVFVVVFEKLSHGLSSHFDGAGLGVYLLMFFAVFWVWNAAVYYVERFESEGLEIRFFTFLTMVAVTGLAIYSHNGMGSNYKGFVAAYLFARILNMIMWARSGFHVKKFRPIAKRFIGGFFIAFILLVISFYTEGAVRLTLFSLAIIIDIITPYFTMKQQAKLPRLSSSKFPERFGLLTIILLGATIVEVIGVLAKSHHLTWPLAIKGVLALFIIFSIWSIYFDFIARRAPKEKITVALFWVYLHLILLAIITIIGIALSGIIEGTHGEAHRMSDAMALLLSTGGTLIVLAILELTLHRKDDELTHEVHSPLVKTLTGAALIGLSFVHFSSGMTPLIICGIGVIIPNIYGTKVFFSHKSEK